MKKLNFLSNLCSSSRADRVRTLAIDAVSLPSFCRVNMLKLCTVLVVLLTVGVGNAWGAVPGVSDLNWGTPALTLNFNSVANVPKGKAGSGSSTTSDSSLSGYGGITHCYIGKSVADKFTVKAAASPMSSQYLETTTTTKGCVSGFTRTFEDKGAYSFVIAKTSITYIGLYAAHANESADFYTKAKCSVYLYFTGSKIQINSGSGWVDAVSDMTDLPNVFEVRVVYNNSSSSATYNGGNTSLGAKSAHIYVNGSAIPNAGGTAPKDFTIPGATLTGFRIGCNVAGTSKVDDINIYDALPTAAGTSVTLSKAATSNGSFTLRSGSCSGSEISSVTTTSSAQTVYIVPVANDGYEISSVTSKLGDAAAENVSKSGDCYPVTYAKDASGTAVITVTFSCVTPTFTVHPASKTDYVTTDSPTALGYTASANGASLTQQWQISSDNSSWNDIDGATSATYTPTISTAGTKYYRVVVTNAASGCSTTATSNVATITSASPSYFPQNKTLFFEAKTQSESAWKDGAQCKAWFRDCDSDCGEAPWTYWQTDGDSYKKYYAVVIPSTGNYPYVTIQRFSDYTGNTSWGEGGAQTYSTGGGSNVIKSTCASGECLSWSPTTMQIYLRGDISNDEWESNIGELTDQNGGIWSYTYNNYASDGSSLAFKLYTNYNTWIGNTSDNNNATLSGMNDGSTYNITATYNVVDHSLVMSKTFVKGEVSFDLQGHGAAISKLTNVAAGSKISAPSTPTDGSYIFGGWYKEPACTNAWDFANDVVNETMTLYAKWYQVTLVVKDDASATLSGDGKPTLTRSGASLTAATAGLYTFKDIQITSGTGTLSSTSSLTPTINSVSSNITVTATFWKPRTVTKGTGTGTSTFTLSATSVAYNGSMTITCAADATHKNPWTLTVTPSDGATYSSSGSAGSITISNITKNITVDLAYTAKSTATVKLHVAGSTSTIPGTRYEGDNYTLPTTAADCPDVSLYGWYTEDYEHATTAPSGANFYLPGATATLTGGENKFYAVYAEMNETANTYTKITTTDQLVTGDYLIVAYYSSSYIEAMANTVNSSDYMDEVQMKTFVNSTSNPTTINLGSDNPAIRWRITNNGNTVNFYNAAVNKYFSTGTGTPTLANSAEEFSYSVSSGRWSFVYDNTYLIYTTNYYVGNTEDKPIYLFKRDVTMANYTTSPSCVTHDLTVVASPVAGGSAEALLTVLGEGKTTTATATPDEHYTFSYWTISGAGSSMSNTVDSKSTDNPVTVTMGTANATLTAHFTEKEKCTVVFKNNGTQVSSTTYWRGENPVAPTLTDGTDHDACDETSDTHYGWTQTTMPDVVPSKATIDAYTGAQTVYAKAATLPAITAGDDGTTITYHAVWAEAVGVPSNEYQLVTSISQLSAGDKIVIANAGSSSTYLMGKDTVTEAGYQFRKVAQVGSFSISSSKITISTLASSATDRNNPHVFTVGKSGDYWTFYDPLNSAYISCASVGDSGSGTKNGLGYESPLSDAGKWSISISDNVATILSQIGSSTTTRNRLQANGNPFSTASSFTCTKNTMTDPYIFRNLSTLGYQKFLTTCCANIVEAPEVTGTPTKNSITLSWTNVTGATGYTVTCSGGTPGDVTSDGTARSCVITGLSPNTNYTWSVVATYTTPYCLANTANGNTTTSQVYAVSYNKNGGTIANLPSGGTYAAGEEVTVAAKPDGTVSKGGYTFTGWNTANDGSGEHYNADGSTSFTMPSEAVVLYAEWTAKKNYFIDRMHGNWDGEHTEPTTGYNCYVREGAGYTVPDLSDNDTGSNSCVSGHAHFIGWVASGNIDAQGGLKSGYTIIKGGTSGTASVDGTIYYAVWAEE